MPLPFISQISPFGEGTWIQNLAWYLISMLFFMVFFLFYNRIQVTLWLRDIAGALNRLKVMRDDARRVALTTINEIGKPQEDITQRVDRFLEYFEISPVNLDPAGIILKLEHLIDVRDERFKDEVKMMAPASDEAQVHNLENLLEATWALNTIYRIVRHFYLFGKKTMSFYIIMQLQMLLPIILQEAEAYSGALNAFANGQPIGDGAGALVAAKLMHNYEKIEVAKDVVMAEVPLDGRKLLTLKAKGPGGNVGRPGEGVKALLDKNEGKVSTVIMIDAALKFEGEKTGEISEGIGAAIGGEGVERYKIEEVATRYKVPVNALIIKESIQEAISPMKKEIFQAADEAITRIRRILAERTKEGDIVIVAGIGNTIGIAQ